VEVSGSHSPHVTLARFRKHTRRGSARPVSDALRQTAVSEERPDRIAEIQVVSSELTTSAPRYVTLCSMPLGRRV
jgi:2'-5' RNA ligase